MISMYDVHMRINTSNKPWGETISWEWESKKKDVK